MKFKEYLPCPKCDAETVVEGEMIREYGRTHIEGDVTYGCRHANLRPDEEWVEEAAEMAVTYPGD